VLWIVCDELCLHIVYTVGHGKRVECKEDSIQKKEKRNAMKIQHTNEMAAVYFAMSCECLKIEANIR